MDEFLVAILERPIASPCESDYPRFTAGIAVLGHAVILMVGAKGSGGWPYASAGSQPKSAPPFSDECGKTGPSAGKNLHPCVLFQTPALKT